VFLFLGTSWTSASSNDPAALVRRIEHVHSCAAEVIGASWSNLSVSCPSDCSNNPNPGLDLVGNEFAAEAERRVQRVLAGSLIV
jgi:hypothetical protein